MKHKNVHKFGATNKQIQLYTLIEEYKNFNDFKNILNYNNDIFYEKSFIYQVYNIYKGDYDYLLFLWGFINSSIFPELEQKIISDLIDMVDENNYKQIAHLQSIIPKGQFLFNKESNPKAWEIYQTLGGNNRQDKIELNKYGYDKNTIGEPYDNEPEDNEPDIKDLFLIEETKNKIYKQIF